MNLVIFAGIFIAALSSVPVMLQLRRHPRGLFVLFFAEMWERFSFYGMRGILIFYLTEQFLFSDAQATAQYGSYTTLVYLLPLIGGVVADRYIGTRKAIAFGALLLVAGHLTMAVEGKPAQQVLTYQGHQYEIRAEGRGSLASRKIMVAERGYSFGASADGGIQIRNLPAAAPIPHELPKGAYSLSVLKQDPTYTNFFYLAISLIVMGVGFLKANISSLVGQLYPQNDPRRDSGFTLYYYGINLGSFSAGLLCTWLGENVGWYAGFGLAGLGMLAGFVVFVVGRPLLMGHGEPPDAKALAKPILGPLNLENFIYAAGLAGVALVFFLVRQNALVGWLLGICSVAVLAYVGRHAFTKGDKVERERLFLALILIAGSTVFWTLFEQAGSSLNLFAERNVVLNLWPSSAQVELFGHRLFIGDKAQLLSAGLDPDTTWWLDTATSAGQTQSLNPGFLLMFAPVFAGLWTALRRRRLDPNPLVKFGLALIQVGLGFLILVWGASYVGPDFKVPMVFLAFAYLLHTTGELSLSPVGMSQITKLAPPLLISTMMAVWFLSLSWAEFIGGHIATLTGSNTVGGQVLDPHQSLLTAENVFLIIGAVGVAVGLGFLVISRWAKHWSHGADEVTDAV